MRSRSSLGIVLLGLQLALALTTPDARALAQHIDEVIPPPPVGETAPPEVVPPPVTPRSVSEVQPPPRAVPVRSPETWNFSAPSPATQFGSPAGNAPPLLQPGVRRGDSREDRAQSGEIIDLMITSGAYGMLLANGIVNWSGVESRSSGSDLVNIRFGATFVGATLSLTGLLAMDAPRGTPTVMAIGLRYGTIAGGLMAGALRTDGNATLGAMVAGGLLGFGLGAGLGYALRPHVSRARFVEAGAFWGAGLGFITSGALRGDVGVTFGLGVGGMTLGMLTHALVASLSRVSVGRGWLLNVAFAAPSGLAALLAVIGSGGSASQEVVFGLSAGFGVLGLGIIMAVTDGLQDSGWVEDNDVLASLHLGVAPTADGQGGTVSVSGEF